MFNDKVTSNEIKINGKTPEVEEYIYLKQRITLIKDHGGGIKRRIKIYWKASGMNRDLLKSKMPMCLKRKVYNQCVIPAMTWKLTKRTENLLKIAQRAVERAILGITMRSRHRSTWLRAKTRVKDIVQVVENKIDT